MGKKDMQAKLGKVRRLIAVMLCVIMATGTGVSSLAELGPLNIWIPLASDSNATPVSGEEDTEESRVIVASWSDATLSDATASNAVNWQALLQARIDALPSIQEIREDDTNELLVDTYWEVLDIMDVLNDQVGVALYDSIMDADDGSIEGADELDVSRLYEIADYVMRAYSLLGASQQMQDLNFVEDDVITVEPYGFENEITMTLEVAGDYDIVDSDSCHDHAYFSFYTGETLTLDFTIDGVGDTGYEYRIYFKLSDPSKLYSSLPDTGIYEGYEGKEKQLVFYGLTDYDLPDGELEDGEVYGSMEVGSYTALLRWDADEEAFYLDFSGITQDGTLAGTLQMTYPSETTPGGDLIIYGVVYDGQGSVASTNIEAFNASWKTQPETFQVNLSLDETQEINGLILQSDGSGNVHVAVKDNPDQDIIYTITMTNTTEETVTDENIGEDLILYIDVTDTITLPAGIKIESNVFVAQETSSGDIEFIADGASGDPILKLVNSSGIQASGYSLGYDADTNTLTLKWTIENSSAGDSGFPEEQIEDGVWEVRLNGEYLLRGDEDAFNAETTHVITSTVKYDYYYTWSGNLDNDDDAELSIAEPSSNVMLTKTADRSDSVVMGEDASYTITLYNQGLIGTTDLSLLADDQLDEAQYITPANIMKMFFGDESDTTENLATDSGEYLTIVVTGAMVYYDTPLALADLDVLSDMDGNATVYKSVANYDMDGRTAKYSNATITITRKDSESLSVVFSSGGTTFYDAVVKKDSDELEELFLRIGYVVTKSAIYSVYWDLTDHQLAGSETRNYKLYSTVKDTFRYWDGLYLNYASGINEASNTVTLQYDNSGRTEEDDDYKDSEYAQAEYTTIGFDYQVIKTVSEIDGDANADTDYFYRDSIVTYKLTVVHNGNGVAEDLPLIDVVSGSQLLLVPVTDENIASVDAGNWPISLTTFTRASNWVTYNGQDYYPLTTSGTYYNVWLDSKHCAASVKVDGTYYNNSSNNKYPNSMGYTITWNYDTIEGTLLDEITYHMQVGSKSRVTNASNIVYLNGRYNDESTAVNYHTSALYDKIDSTQIRSGSLKKQILTSEWDVDAEEETYADSSVLDLEENMTTVYYKLELNAKSGNEPLTFEDVKDILPYTYGLFEWNDRNVTVYPPSYVNPQSDEDIPVLSYEIRYSDADGNLIEDSDVAAYISENGNPYQMISWGDVDLPEDRQGIWIYVKLDFPATAAEWEAYVSKVNGYLKNTLASVIENANDEATVIHSVKKDAKAYLQKGVFWISNPTQAEATTLVSDSTSREIYYNSSGDAQDGSLVAYYIQLYNASSSYLYLTEIQDVVPEGFELAAIYSGVSDYTERKNGAALGGSITADTSSPASCLKDENGDEISGVTWIPVTVIPSTNEDGVLCFELQNSSKMDETLGYPYLEEGEAISFIAEFRVGTESQTEDYAVNKIAMPYVTLSGSSLSVAANVNGKAEEMSEVSASYSSPDQNVGGCSILSEPDEREYEGFQAVTPSVGEVSQWLFSEVTVNRGEIIPGIHKSLATDESTGINGRDVLDWDIEVTNDGTIEMVNYTLTDNVDSPYLIRGNVYYEICDTEKSVLAVKNYSDVNLDPTDYEDSTKTLPLFSIERSSKDKFDIAWYQIVDDAVEKVTIWGNDLGEPVSIYPTLYVFNSGWGDLYNRADDAAVEVTVNQDDDGNDYVSINFSGSDLKIPAGGKSKMKIQTQTLDTVTASRGTYYNIATVIPVQSYDDKLVTVGETVSAADPDSGAAYIKSSDQVHVSNGYSTNAQKWIQSIDDPTKIARSEEVNVNGVHYIDLTGTNERFTYTLEVTNSLKNPMTNLVIVDTLPESGDYAPFTNAERSQRYSKFQVDLLTDNLGWSVLKGKKATDSGSTTGDLSARDTMDEDTIEYVSSKAGDGEYYTVYYSTSTDLGIGLKGNDSWSLDSSSVSWTDDPTGARAVRIEIQNANIEPEQVVQVSFNAIISSDSEDTAEPGEIGWNSFAYQYTTARSSDVTIFGDDDDEATTAVGTSDTTTLWAAPRKVGVRIPGVPWLTKKLVGVDTGTALEEQTFRFLVHEGEKLTDFDYSDNSDGKLEENLKAALEADETFGTDGRAYIIKELTIDVSEGVSKSILLNDPDGKLTYTNGEKYTVVELPSGDSTEPGNDRFAPSSLSDGSTYTTENVITFTFSKSSVVEVTAANKGIDWWIRLLKQDADTGEELKGVVFGLYSSTNPKYDSDYLDKTYGDLLTTPSDAARISIDGEEGTWYLIEMKETDADGTIRWEDLTESVYYLKELKTGDGYYLPADPIRVDYWSVADGDYYTQSESSTSGVGKIITVTVNNKIGYNLPKTGGHGALWIQLLGLLLMSMGVSLTYITKRKITSSRRTK